jgi:hypothetical protein|tara:strand:+ start:136 stop:4281 length:4146 start_codon:yes stop_codon:yes gene_type:complete
MIKKTYLIIFFSVLFGATIHVPEDYPTIQEGIDASIDGDTVLVGQGTYYENLMLEKEIVLASHAIYDDLDSDWLNNVNITGTIISGAQEPSDPNKGSCLIIRDGDIQPEIIGLTFQDGDGTSMQVANCGVIYHERSGGGILMYKAYPTIMYNRFINNGHDNDNVRAGRGGRIGGAMGHYADDDVEFDEDRSSSSWNNNRNSKTIAEYIFDTPAALDAYNNGMNLQEIQDSRSSIDASTFNESEEILTDAHDNDFDRDEIPDTLNIRNNYFENNASGDGANFYSHGYEGSIDVSNSIFEDIDCETNSVNDYVLRSIEDEADYIQNEISGDCIESSSFYVSSTGNDNNDGTVSEPLKTIGHALTLVRDGEIATTINLASGIYSPSINGEKFPIILPDNVEIIGEGTETTILDAEADDENEAAVMIIKEVENVRVANLTLTGGSTESIGCTGGGGLLITANDMFNLDTEGGTNFKHTGAVIEDVIIEGNWSHNGGGLSIFRSSGSVINNVTIRDNACSAFGGGVFTYGSQISMTSVTITQNNNLTGTAQGGGIMMPVTGGTLDNMTITDNLGCCKGAGIWTNNSDWIMTNSIISGNHGTDGSALGMLESEPTLINVTMSDNTSDGNGGALWSFDSSPNIRNCTITGNTALGADMGGGVMWAMGVGEPSFTDCLISDNSAPNSTAGIWSMGISSLWLTRVTITGNSGEWNPGIFISDCFDDGSYIPAYITNSTITGNSSSNGGAIRVTCGGHAQVVNSIVWDNNTPSSVSSYGGTANITYSDIQGGWGGWTNMNTDPLFTDPGSGDFTLQETSPCIDEGTADINDDGTDDIDYVGSAPDMGAFELGGILGCTDPEAENFDPEANMNDGSCQFGPPVVTYNNGWNIVGLAVEVEDPNYQTLFPNAQEGTLYSFGTGYENQVELVEGNGYLLRMTSDDTVAFAGTPIQGVNIAITEGWNLFSGTGSNLSVEDLYENDIVYPGTVYGLDANYFNPESIEPGRGYWVRGTEDGEITLGSDPSEFMMTIVLDNYPSETTWDLSGPEGVVANGGPYSEAGGLVEFSATLMPGDYVWTIYDQYGDGICCGFGNGSYELMLDGETIANGGNFGGIESVNFTVGARNHVNSLTTTHLPDGVEYSDVKGDIPLVGYVDFITETIEYSDIHSNGSAKLVSIMKKLESSNSITFSSGLNSSELYFGVVIPEEEILSYSLPPVFPQMTFDVRFSNNSKVVSESGEIVVIAQTEMITIEYDIKVDAGSRHSWVLTSESGNDYTLKGTGEITVPSEERFVLNKEIIIPLTFTLHQNFPNPFNPITTLRYDLPTDAFVSISIYDMLGREVTKLVNTSQQAGFKSIKWDAKNSFGKPVSAGVYLYQIEAGDFVQTRKMVLLK